MKHLSNSEAKLLIKPSSLTKPYVKQMKYQHVHLLGRTEAKSRRPKLQNETPKTLRGNLLWLRCLQDPPKEFLGPSKEPLRDARTSLMAPKDAQGPPEPPPRTHKDSQGISKDLPRIPRISQPSPQSGQAWRDSIKRWP